MPIAVSYILWDTNGNIQFANKQICDKDNIYDWTLNARYAMNIDVS